MDKEIQIITACDGEEYLIITEDDRWKDSPYMSDNEFTNQKILPKKKGIYRLTIKVIPDCEREIGYIAYEYSSYEIIKIEKVKNIEFEIYVNNPKSQKKLKV